MDSNQRRVLIWSNAPWVPSGYGQQSAALIESLVELDYHVAFLASYGQESGAVDWGEHRIKVYPRGFQRPWGEDILPHVLNAEKPDVVLTLCNEWALNARYWKWMRKQFDFKLLCWCPVERQPLPSAVSEWFAETEATPVPMTEFGYRELLKAGLDPMRPMPHTLNLEEFRPGEADRSVFSIDDDVFVASMVAANKGHHKVRKSFPQVFIAWKQFLRDYPDAVLLLHSAATSLFSGPDLGRLWRMLGIPDRNVRVTPPVMQYLSPGDDQLANIYRSSDVLLMPSMGEGFGLPAIEAQACGTPVVTNAWTAQPELTFNGELVDGILDWDEKQQGWLMLPDPRNILSALHNIAERDSETRDKNSGYGVLEMQRFGREEVRDKHLGPLLESMLDG